MIPIPDKERDIIPFANDLKEQCCVSLGMRQSYYRLMNALAETGRYTGEKSLISMLYKHLDRTAAHLFSPVELKFSIDFEKPYPRRIYDMGAEVGKVITRSWERTNTDVLFGRGTFEALKYGWAGLKQFAEEDGDHVNYKRRLVMPWSFGVYREDHNDIDDQEALCETYTLTLPEVWRRIWHLDGAERLFDKVRSHAKKSEITAEPTSFFHQVLSTSQLNTGTSSQVQTGGIVNLINDPNYAIMGPVVAADTVKGYELWIKGEKGYKTLQIIEPDILITRNRLTNLFIKDSKLHPYSSIQPNEITNWFWGRSELVDLIKPQELLSTWCDDLTRLFGLQIDKVLAFIGESGVTDEMYGQFRQAGYLSLTAPGSKVEDLTPKIPPEALPMIKFVIETINVLGGFPNIMQGQGEQGVRAGVHASTLLKTASPTLRDRALLVERQCAIAADKTLQLKEAKDPSNYWLKADNPIQDVDDTKFLLTDLPEDWRVTVDSHSSSPIFSDENQQLVFAAHRLGVVDGEYVIDNTNLPNKEAAKVRLRMKEEKQAQMMQQLMQQHPEVLAKMFGQKGGRK